MHTSNSILKTVIERVRGYLDEPSSKYNNDYLTRYIIMPEMVNVFNRVQLNADNVVLCRHTVSLVKGQESYQLPPCVGEVHRVATYDSYGNIVSDWRSDGENHPRGPGWMIEGCTLSFRPYPVQAEDVDLWYVSNGDFSPHYSSSGGSLTDASTLVLGDAEIGEVDRRPQAYAGSVLRLLPDAPGVVEERIIDTHDPSAVTPYVTVRVPFTHNVTGSIKYEITPPGMATAVQAISASAALNLGVSKNISEKLHGFLRIEYRKGLKTAGDIVANMNQKHPKGWDRRTIDNTSGHMWFLT
jgi:hypothetical protein